MRHTVPLVCFSDSASIHHDTTVNPLKFRVLTGAHDTNKNNKSVPGQIQHIVLCNTALLRNIKFQPNRATVDDINQEMKTTLDSLRQKVAKRHMNAVRLTNFGWRVARGKSRSKSPKASQSSTDRADDDVVDLDD
jgi:hypothetical protein